MSGAAKAKPAGAELEVLEPGLSTTVQDLGRPGWMRIGLPQGGALDREALRLANAVVGGLSSAASADAAGLEIRCLGPSLKVRSGVARAALVGADAQMRLKKAGSDAEAERIGPWRSVTLTAGDVLRVGALKASSTAVLAFAGGVSAPVTLGARATFERGGFGGVEGRALRAGDLLQLGAPQGDLSGPECWIPPDRRPATHLADASGAQMARVVLGPQERYFTPETVGLFLAAEWIVTREADRMGLRLDGPALPHRDGVEGGAMLSEGVPEGAIQVPAGGAPILLLADRGATGGYPKIAVAASVDLPLIGRLQPGDRLRFVSCSAHDARLALLRREEALKSALSSVEVMLEPGVVDEEKLWSDNLITAQTSYLFDD